ncbi:DUF7281 domain-containing protein [Azospira sp. I09]|jgi:hypothetical protein|uniref:DUF7281 domain-containing protein n=1 Tax=Azospira sp. I09 TaxID=1765049 RepID=UPI0012610DB5|nr:hypothetical protein [Azospira sp. I09]BBN88806.1 hypothetical protein AZSP09_18290 [Azospira sp. I09]
MMDKRLINTLLRIFHSPETRFTSGRAISDFCVEYNLGVRRGNSLVFNDAHKAEIGRILKGELGIDPSTTTADSWKGLGRAESLMLARDEKLTSRTVGDHRLRVKALPGRVLQVAGGSWSLPDRADLGMDLNVVLGSEIGHDALLIIENLQTFDDIHAVDSEVMDNLTSHDPLVIYRGDNQGGARADAVHALISGTGLPVIAFVDFDPAGLIIASGLPRLDMVLAPPLQDLAEIIQVSGIAKRYLEQVAMAAHAMQRIQGDARMTPLWRVIHAAGKALPQEYFHRRSK